MKINPKRAMMIMVMASGLAGAHMAQAAPVRSHMDAHETSDHAERKRVHGDKTSDQKSADQKQEDYEQKYAIPQDRGADLPN